MLKNRMGSKSYRSKKNITLRRKYHILRSLNASKSHANNRSAFMDTFHYIYLLKNKLEALKRDYSNLLAIKRQYSNILTKIQVPKEVKVEKTNEGLFTVKVRCEKEEDTLVSVLQAFEELGLHVLQARVSCNDKSFSMEATAVAQTRCVNLNAEDVTEAITKATQKSLSSVP